MIRETMRRVLEGCSPAFRYFVQPLSIAYYAPLLILRYRVTGGGPTGTYYEEGRRYHEVIVDGWRRAVEAAERANADGYWPVHLSGKGVRASSSDDGTITATLPPDANDIIDLVDGFERSFEEAASFEA
jgi:hypothetical protein